MDNIYVLGIIISFIFLICKIIEVKIIHKENLDFKKIIKDSMIIYICVILANFILEQINNQTNNLYEAPVFTDGPAF